MRWSAISTTLRRILDKSNNKQAVADVRGVQNSDAYFQARETVNPYYVACPMIVQHTMDHFAALDRTAVPFV